MEEKQIAKQNYSDLQRNLDIINAFKSQVDEVAKNCNSIKVVDENTLAICQQNLAKVTQLDKAIKDKVKEIRKPYNDELDKISAVGNPLSEPLTEAAKHLKKEVLDWDKKKKDKQAILEYINGKVTDSLKGYFDRAKTSKDCSDFTEIINKHWPAKEKFGEFNSIAEAIRDKYLLLLKTKKIALELGYDGTLEDLDESASQVPVFVPAVSIPTKNIRKTWTFELIDITKVPAEWLQLNESVVKEYLSANKESLKDKEIKDGVKFYKKETVTS